MALYNFMKKTVRRTLAAKRPSASKKAADATPTMALRLSSDLGDRIDAWAGMQKDRPNRAEAVRRLLVVGLKTERSKRPISTSSAAKAAELAGNTLDTLGDESASALEREQRKRRLLKGPKEFR
jgi:hypothetical protein